MSNVIRFYCMVDTAAISSWVFMCAGDPVNMLNVKLLYIRISFTEHAKTREQIDIKFRK